MHFASEHAYLSDHDEGSESGGESVDEMELEQDLDGFANTAPASMTFAGAAAAPAASAAPAAHANTLPASSSAGRPPRGSSGFLSSLFSRSASPTAPSLSPAPAPAPASSPAPASASASEPIHQQQQQQHVQPAYRSAGASKSRYRRKVDTNVLSLALGSITATASIATGDLNACTGCGACLSSLSKLTKSEEDVYDWCCEFCGHSQTVELDEAEIPTTGVETVDYIVEAAPTASAAPGAAAATSENTDLVIFVVDISGSMCCTTEVPGKVQIKGAPTASSQAALRRTHGGDRDQYLPGQRRDVTYISRMQAVQAAINHQISELAKCGNPPRVGLITFSSDVTCHGDGTGTPTIITGDKLRNLDVLVNAGRQARSMMGLKVDSTEKALSDTLFGLEESGPTALGPAVAVALGMAGAGANPGATQAGGGGSKRIVLCTDGLANVGLGALDEIPEGPNPVREQAEGFYSSLGETSQAAGIVVDVISIVGQDADLENLGAMSEATGGTVVRVDPLSLQQDFAGILANPVLATNVQVKVILHGAMRFRHQGEAELVPVGTPNASSTTSVPPPATTACADAAVASAGGGDGGGGSSGGGGGGGGSGGGGSVVAKTKHHQNVETKLVGNVTADTEMSFEYQVKPRAERVRLGFKEITDLPFQVQIAYTRLDGSKYVRVISQIKPVSKDRSVCEASAKINLLSAHAMQTSGFLAGEGDYTSSRVHNRAMQKMMQRCAKSDNDQRTMRAWRTEIGAMDNELRSEMIEEIDEVSEGAGDNMSYGARFRSSGLSKKSKASRKAQRSNNDRLSTMIYKSKQTSSKKF